ncbi:epoxyqueuosine reductase [Rhodonellum psychrophilum GCM71 = DSM 17998]|uniref:Epoxyqueuosine reductase n=2 Tax=Rhodonellum TaxID=336827 RepID=U5C251_9BACT|nr:MULTISPECIES: tRNA epoxyqueuosine(34) reductase QueG [Rhodonellum]ERM83859.1 epoxyqueuosine reductase [Rhodonellum psychrophilum GCM71 = DSM 17998]MDO9554368.1 tRNA epoxyqueuosine(34) reductase QueG [Rhodonellum sp.]SDY66856.1 epoxyqueuosine reductase [Rhodonellum ikkaensis]
MNVQKDKYAQIIKTQAKNLGFDFCGVAKAEFLKEEAPKLEDWLNKNHHGEMAYMANHFDKRLDPTLLVEGAKTVISLIYNYYPEKRLPDSPENLKIAKYAYGEDYHFVIKEKLKTLLTNLRTEIGEFGGRAFVDSAPVMERQWAQKSGLGWQGKNSLLLNRQMGSFFFLAELIIDLEVTPDPPMIKDYCGTCTKCVDACPTDAIVQAGVVDGSKCISYFTIELKDQIPNEMKGKFENWVFGCDICQDVCPWNSFSKPHQEAKFAPHPDLKTMGNKDWQELTEETFNKVFQKSAIKRTKFQGLLRNINFNLS